MSTDTIERAVRADRDAQPLTESDFRMKWTPQAISSGGFGIDAEEFAARYHAPLGTLRDWEPGRAGAGSRRCRGAELSYVRFRSLLYASWLPIQNQRRWSHDRPLLYTIFRHSPSKRLASIEILTRSFLKSSHFSNARSCTSTGRLFSSLQNRDVVDERNEFTGESCGAIVYCASP